MTGDSSRRCRSCAVASDGWLSGNGHACAGVVASRPWLRVVLVRRATPSRRSLHAQRKPSSEGRGCNPFHGCKGVRAEGEIRSWQRTLTRTFKGASVLRPEASERPSPWRGRRTVDSARRVRYGLRLDAESPPRFRPSAGRGVPRVRFVAYSLTDERRSVPLYLGGACCPERGRAMAAVVTPIRRRGVPWLRVLPPVGGGVPSTSRSTRRASSTWRTVRVRVAAGQRRWTLVDVACGDGHVHVRLFGGWRTVRRCRPARAAQPFADSAVSPTHPDAA